MIGQAAPLSFTVFWVVAAGCVNGMCSFHRALSVTPVAFCRHQDSCSLRCHKNPGVPAESNRLQLTLACPVPSRLHDTKPVSFRTGCVWTFPPKLVLVAPLTWGTERGHSVPSVPFLSSFSLRMVHVFKITPWDLMCPLRGDPNRNHSRSVKWHIKQSTEQFCGC